MQLEAAGHLHSFQERDHSFLMRIDLSLSYYCPNYYDIESMDYRCLRLYSLDSSLSFKIASRTVVSKDWLYLVAIATAASNDCYSICYL